MVRGVVLWMCVWSWWCYLSVLKVLVELWVVGVVFIVVLSFTFPLPSLPSHYSLSIVLFHLTANTTLPSQPAVYLTGWRGQGRRNATAWDVCERRYFYTQLSIISPPDVTFSVYTFSCKETQTRRPWKLSWKEETFQHSTPTVLSSPHISFVSFFFQVNGTEVKREKRRRRMRMQIRNTLSSFHFTPNGDECASGSEKEKCVNRCVCVCVCVHVFGEGNVTRLAVVDQGNWDVWWKETGNANHPKDVVVDGDKKTKKNKGWAGKIGCSGVEWDLRKTEWEGGKGKEIAMEKETEKTDN